jgi:hypothetical protein
MNKKVNTALFILGATVFNLVLMLVLFAVPLVAILAIFGDKLQQAFGIISVVLFFAALVGSFFLYGLIMKKVAAKWELEKHLHPIFAPKKK